MDKVATYSRRVKYVIYVFKGLSFLLFFLLIYSLFSVLSNTVINLGNLFLVLELGKAALTSIIGIIFGFMIFFGQRIGTPELISRFLESLFPFYRSSTLGATSLTEFAQDPTPLISGIIMLILIIICLYGFGFIKTGEYEYVLWSFLLMLVALLLGISFLPTQLRIPTFQVGNVSEMFASPLFRFLITLYFFLVVGQQLSYFSSVLVPISKRAERISSKITVMERVGEAKEEKRENQSREKGGEKKGLIEQLSSLSMSTLSDAYKGYSFADRGSQQFTSSKLKSFVEKEESSKPDLLDSLAGKASLPNLKKYFSLALLSFLVELSIAFPIGFLALIAPSLMQTAPYLSEIYIIGQYEFSVFIIFMFILAFFLLTEFIERRVKG